MRVHPFCPPDGWKISRLVFGKSPHSCANLIRPDFLFSDQTGRTVSKHALTSLEDCKNLCERRALPTELYPQKNWSAGRHSSHRTPLFKHCAGSASIARRMTIAFSTPIG